MKRRSDRHHNKNEGKRPITKKQSRTRKGDATQWCDFRCLLLSAFRVYKKVFDIDGRPRNAKHLNNAATLWAFQQQQKCTTLR